MQRTDDGSRYQPETSLTSPHPHPHSNPYVSPLPSPSLKDSVISITASALFVLLTFPWLHLCINTFVFGELPPFVEGAAAGDSVTAKHLARIRSATVSMQEKGRKLKRQTFMAAKRVKRQTVMAAGALAGRRSEERRPSAALDDQLDMFANRPSDIAVNNPIHEQGHGDIEDPAGAKERQETSSTSISSKMVASDDPLITYNPHFWWERSSQPNDHPLLNLYRFNILYSHTKTSACLSGTTRAKSTLCS